jgi:hypothetical protein
MVPVDTFIVLLKLLAILFWKIISSVINWKLLRATDVMDGAALLPLSSYLHVLNAKSVPLSLAKNPIQNPNFEVDK